MYRLQTSDALAATHHSLLPEVNPHCAGELAVELVVRVPVEEGGLAHSRVAQSQQLNQVVIIPVSHRCQPSAPPTMSAKVKMCYVKKKKKKSGR